MTKGISFLLFLICGLFIFKTHSQRTETVSSYVEKYKNVSIQHMQKYGIPVSIKLAQGILESGFGNSELAIHANNHFGIKCHGWRHATYYKDDDKANECFRSYRDPILSYEDHSEFLSTRERYSFLFDLDPLDYRGWALGLREAGYATNPDYPQLLIRIIEEHELYKYDRKGLQSDKLTSRPTKTSTPHPSRPAAIQREREIKLNNNIKFVYARQGETPEDIAEEMGVWPWQIYNYNDLEYGAIFNNGDIVYLQPKRRRSETNYHIVRAGETMYEISQIYGVRLDKLYSRNNMSNDSLPEQGQKIFLRGRARN